MREARPFAEVIYQRLTIIDGVVDQGAKVCTIGSGIQLVEAIDDQLGMFVIVCENDCLADLLTPGDLLAILHQVLKHFVNRINVENIAENL